MVPLLLGRYAWLVRIKRHGTNGHWLSSHKLDHSYLPSLEESNVAGTQLKTYALTALQSFCLDISTSVTINP